MKCTIEINMNNSAFEDDPNGELARILNNLSKSLAVGPIPYSIWDINGNRVGQMVIE